MGTLFLESEVFEKPLQEIKSLIDSHDFTSGEIILKLSQYTDKYLDLETLISKFLVFHKIQVVDSINSGVLTDLSKNLCKISYSEVETKLKYALSTKANYTCIKVPFSELDIKEIKSKFLALFTQKPVYFTFKECEIFSKDLSMEYPWLSGGVLVIDQTNIGLLWVNDLYD